MLQDQETVRLTLPPNRLEEPWGTSAEEMLALWSSDCQAASETHAACGKHFKRLFTYWSIPGLLLSVVMGGVTGVLADDPNIQYVNMVGFITLGAIQGVNSFFNFGKKEQRHFEYATRYLEISTNIQAELVKNRAFRIPADVFLTEMRMCKQQLDRNAPVI
jgi:hypothetical protein